MKKNVIIVFLDSFWYGYLNNNSLGEPVMPFLDSLSDKAFIVKNSFSPGPYTEAALRGVMSSIKTLDHMGYDLFLGQEDSNYIDFFYNNGYEI